MTKLLLAALALLLAFSGFQTWRLSAVQAEATKLRSTVQALESTLDRNSRATAVHSKRLKQAQAKAVAAAIVLEQALAVSPAWADQPVPAEVQAADGAVEPRVEPEATLPAGEAEDAP